VASRGYGTIGRLWSALVARFARKGVEGARRDAGREPGDDALANVIVLPIMRAPRRRGQSATRVRPSRR